MENIQAVLVCVLQQQEEESVGAGFMPHSPNQLCLLFVVCVGLATTPCCARLTPVWWRVVKGCFCLFFSCVVKGKA
jgi:hypothetical protein